MIIRYSQLDSFLSCPMGYKRRYIDKIEDPEKSSALELGTALHLAIKTVFDGGDPIEVFDLLWNSFKNTEMKYYRHSWEDLRYLALQKWIPNFVRLHASHFSNTKQEETLEMPFHDHKITGTYDLAGDYDGVLSICDWKTSKNKYEKSKIEKNPQMWIYAELYRVKYGVLPKQLIYIVFRKDTGSIQTLETEVTEEKLARQLENVHAIIRNIEFCINNNVWYHSFDCWCKE